MKNTTHYLNIAEKQADLHSWGLSADVTNTGDEVMITVPFTSRVDGKIVGGKVVSEIVLHENEDRWAYTRFMVHLEDDHYPLLCDEALRSALKEAVDTGIKIYRAVHAECRAQALPVPASEIFSVVWKNGSPSGYPLPKVVSLDGLAHLNKQVDTCTTPDAIVRAVTEYFETDPDGAAISADLNREMSILSVPQFLDTVNEEGWDACEEHVTGLTHVDNERLATSFEGIAEHYAFLHESMRTQITDFMSSRNIALDDYQSVARGAGMLLTEAVFVGADIATRFTADAVEDHYLGRWGNVDGDLNTADLINELSRFLGSRKTMADQLQSQIAADMVDAYLECPHTADDLRALVTRLAQHTPISNLTKVLNTPDLGDTLGVDPLSAGAESDLSACHPTLGE